MSPTFQAADGLQDDLEANPITPSRIIEGHPYARSVCLLRTDDGRLSTTLWDCTAGRFNWFFGCDEIVHIVEGEVVVEDEQGCSRTLRVGDVALFQAGTRATWEVPAYVRKVAVSRVHPPRPLWRRILRRLGRAVRRRPATP
jgi:uncharacterized cupin superfamily protein